MVICVQRLKFLKSTKFLKFNKIFLLILVEWCTVTLGKALAHSCGSTRHAAAGRVGACRPPALGGGCATVASAGSPQPGARGAAPHRWAQPGEGWPWPAAQ